MLRGPIILGSIQGLPKVSRLRRPVQGQGQNEMVDWSRVRNLWSEVGSEDFEEIIAMFLEETDAVIQGLSNDLPPEAMERELHFLKGSALNIGLQSFASLCQQGEKLASSGSAQLDLDEIIRVYWRSRNLLLEQLSSQIAA